MGVVKGRETSYWTGVVGICLISCAVYANALNNPFQYDDYHSIVDNESIRSMRAIPSFFIDPSAFSSRPENAMYRPLLLSSFALNYAISGYSTWSYHLVTLLLHCGCIALLAAIARRLLHDTWGAWLAVALFAIHPLNSECINYISSRSEVLAAFFFLLAFWAYINAEWTGWGRLLLVGGAYACALLSKSIAIVLPAIMVSFDLVHGRSLREQVRTYAIAAFIGGCYIVGIWRFLARATVGEPVRSLGEQFWTQVKAQVFYIKMLLWPSGQNVDHQFLISDTLFDPIAAVSLFFLLSLVAAAWSYRKKYPLVLSCLLWFIIAIAPSSLVPLNVLVNEHRLYLPGAAFFMAIGLAYNRLASARGAQWHFATFAAVAAIVGFSVATVQRNAVWASPLTLWHASATAAPLMARPSIYLGDAYEKDGQMARAIEAYEHALTRDTNFAPLYLRLGKVLLQVEQRQRALKTLIRGTELDDNNADMWGARAEAHRQDGQWQESLEAYLHAVALRPDDDVLHNNLGNTYQILKRPQEALRHHLLALEIKPSDPRTYVNLGNAHSMLGQGQEALAAYARAVEWGPDYAGAWLSYASALEQAGAIQQALAAYARAGQLDPAYSEYAERQINKLRGDLRD